MDAKLKTALKSWFQSCRRLNRHLTHRADAQRLLKSITSVKGRLPTSVVRRCDDYASDVLGRRYYAPWLYVYSAIAGQFKEGWIPENFYDGVVNERICGPYLSVAGLKPLNSPIFRSDSFPDLAFYANGTFFDAGYAVVPSEKLEGVLFGESERVVFKIDNSLQGGGIFFFTRDSFDPARIRELGNGVFQSFIAQHELFERFASPAVATLRLNTCMDERGGFTARSSSIRFGQGSETHLQGATNIKVSIRLADGAFSEVGYSPDWLELDAHPTSGERFAGKAVPNFQACVDLALDLHRKTPFVQCVGWDIAVDATGRPWVLEWNIGYNGIGLTEATQGPCFRDLHWERYRPTGPDRFKLLF